MELFLTFLFPALFILPFVSYFIFLGIRVKSEEQKNKIDFTNELNPFTGEKFKEDDHSK